MRLGLLLTLALLYSCNQDSDCIDPTSLNDGESASCFYADTNQYALFFKFTGTWCPPCGSIGAVKMKETLASNERVIGIEVHHQDEMTSAIGNKFISHFSINSFPSFRVNNDKSTLTSTLTRKPEVGLYLSHKRSGNSLVIESYVKALMDLKASEYYIAVYIMEDGKVAPQYADDHSAYPNWTYENKRYPGYVHDNILRDEASNQTFGQLLHNGPMRKDLVFKHTVEIDISQEFIDVYPLLVIWKRENREYTFVNALRG